MKKQNQKIKSLPQPQHLVANKRAVISDMFIEKGKPLVGVHQYVEKGQLLVSGIISEANETSKDGEKKEKGKKVMCLQKVKYGEKHGIIARRISSKNNFSRFTW